MQESFEEYVTARGQSLLRFAYLLSADHFLAQDLVQEVLARMHSRWRRLERDGNPDAYVRRAIAREFLSWRRRRSNGERPTEVVPERPDRPGEAADRLGDRDEVWRWLSQLPRTQRAVLVLRFYEDMSDARIAEVIGCAESTVRVHATRGLARLRAVLPNQGHIGVGL